MSIIAAAIDPAKNLFALHGAHANGKAAMVMPRLGRDTLPARLARLAPCLTGLQVCFGDAPPGALMRSGRLQDILLQMLTA